MSSWLGAMRATQAPAVVEPPDSNFALVTNQRTSAADEPLGLESAEQGIDPRGPWAPAAPPGDWKYIVLHHTATEMGDVASIDAEHRQRVDREGRAWQGIGYHFVIGNGRGMPDGQIEPTFRWLEQRQGAHAGEAEYNRHGVGVCLVGDFERAAPTARQETACRQLVAYLVERYGIDRRKVVRHGDLKTTACPGRMFPFREMVGSDQAPSGDPVLFQVWRTPQARGSRFAHRPGSRETLR